MQSADNTQLSDHRRGRSQEPRARRNVSMSIKSKRLLRSRGLRDGNHGILAGPQSLEIMAHARKRHGAKTSTTFAGGTVTRSYGIDGLPSSSLLGTWVWLWWLSQKPRMWHKDMSSLCCTGRSGHSGAQIDHHDQPAALFCTLDNCCLPLGRLHSTNIAGFISPYNLVQPSQSRHLLSECSSGGTARLRGLNTVRASLARALGLSVMAAIKKAPQALSYSSCRTLSPQTQPRRQQLLKASYDRNGL